MEVCPAPAKAPGVDRAVAIPYPLLDRSAWRLPDRAAPHRDGLISGLQRKLAHRIRHSRRHRLMRRRIAEPWRSNARARKSLAHVLTAHLARTFVRVAIEEMRIPDMTWSATWAMKELGRNVAAKAGLSWVILNVGWCRLKLLLDYRKGGDVNGASGLLQDPLPGFSCRPAEWHLRSGRQRQSPQP